MDLAGDDEEAEADGGEEGEEDVEVTGGEEVKRAISTQEASRYAEEEGLLFFETSAKTGVNVKSVFEAIAEAIPESTLKPRGGALGAAGGREVREAQAVDLGSANRAKEGCAC